MNIVTVHKPLNDEQITDLFTQRAKTITPERIRELAGEDVHRDEYNDTQRSALDLYARGLNVFPIPYKSKAPYPKSKLKPLFTARLHHCTDLCKHGSRQYNLADLFTRDNIALMCGRTSGNLTALDCDSLTAFEKIGQELAARTIPFWAIRSSRGGAYLLRVIEGEIANTPKDASILQDVEIWGNRHYVILPPSSHPSGKQYEWITPEPRYNIPAGDPPPAVAIKALEWLGVKLAKSQKRYEAPSLYGLPSWGGELSLTSRETYAGIGIAEGNRNTRLFWMLCDIAGNGIEYSEAERIAQDYAARVGLEPRAVSSTLKSAYRKDRTAARNGRGEKRTRSAEWQQALELSAIYDWRATFGRKAQTRKSCYLALIERARLDGRLHFRATTREVAELMQTSADRANKCMRDLQAEPHKLIKRVAYKDAGIYRFILSELVTVRTTGSYSVTNSETPKTQGEQDAFAYLGLNAWYVWKYLLQTTAKNGCVIAAALRLPTSSVYDAITRLKTAKFITSAEGELYAEPMTEGSLQSFALAQFDGSSPSQDRRRRHVIEREQNAYRVTARARSK